MRVAAACRTKPSCLEQTDDLQLLFVALNPSPLALGHVLITLSVHRLDSVKTFLFMHVPQMHTGSAFFPSS